MSTSIFDSSHFRRILSYQPQESSCAIQGDNEASERNKGIIQGLIHRVLEETDEKIHDENAPAYESFLRNVEVIDGEYSSLNYGNPFSDSIAQMRERLSSYKQTKKDLLFTKMTESIKDFDFDKNYAPSVIEKMAPRLKNFAEELIQERLPSYSGVEQKKAYEIAQQIEKIGFHVSSEDIQKLSKQLQISILQRNAVYQGLVSDQAISFENTEAAEKAALKLNDLIEKLAPFLPELPLATTQKLLDRLYVVDSEIMKAGIITDESLVAPAIRHLEVFLNTSPRSRTLPSRSSSPEPKSSKMLSLISRFEEKREETKSSFSRKTSPAATLSPQEKRDKVLSEVQKKLLILPTMSGTEIYQLSTFLQKNKELFPPSDQEGIDRLVYALAKLREPTSFYPSAEEDMLQKHWINLLSNYGITEASYARTIKPVQQETKKELIQLMQENDRSFTQLNSALKNALPYLETKAISKRFIGAEVQQRHHKSFSSNMALNLANTIRHFEGFHHESQDYLDQKWNKLLAKNDAETNGKFSEIIKHLGYCNLGSRRDSICLTVTQSGMKKFMTEDLFTMSETLSPEDYGISLIKLRAQEEIFYKKEVTAKYIAIQPNLKWIKEHIHFFKTVYDQGNDFNRNMGNGTCERNSEDRVKLLLKNPYIPSEAISLGSTQSGRFNEAIREQVFVTKDRNPNELFRQIEKSDQRIGLHRHRIYPISVGQNQMPQEILSRELQRIVEKDGETIFILSLVDNSVGQGHAINIQFDLAKSMFRFIDDNIGIIECPNSETFMQTLSSWLQTAYPNLPDLSLFVFRPTSK